MAPLGKYLCTIHDFLVFTHEFVIILRKVPPKEHTQFPLIQVVSDISYISTIRKIPTCPIDRNSVVMGTIWTFQTHKSFSFSKLIISKIVERFGKDGMVWEMIDFEEFSASVLQGMIETDQCRERDVSNVAPVGQVSGMSNSLCFTLCTQKSTLTNTTKKT